jgi:hypothetical protein
MTTPPSVGQNPAELRRTTGTEDDAVMNSRQCPADKLSGRGRIPAGVVG